MAEMTMILEGSLAELEDLCHFLCGRGVRGLGDTGSFLSEQRSEDGLSPLELMLILWPRETRAFLL